MLAAPVAAYAQNVADGGDAKPIFGTFDPVTRVFTPAPLPDPAPRAARDVAPAAAPIVRKGKIVIRATVKLRSSLPASASITAIATATMDGTDYGNNSRLQVNMQRAAGNATATITLPYHFAAQNASEKIVVQLIYTAQFVPGVYATFKQNVPLPANGATTNVTVAGTL